MGLFGARTIIARHGVSVRGLAVWLKLPEHPSAHSDYQQHTTQSSRSSNRTTSSVNYRVQRTQTEAARVRKHLSNHTDGILSLFSYMLGEQYRAAASQLDRVCAQHLCG